MHATGAIRSRLRLSPLALLTLACAGVFVAALDQTVVVTALPRIFNDIALPVTDLDRGSWIITGYLLGYTAAMPLMGRVSDVYGHGRVYLAAMALFVVGSALVAVGHSLEWIIAARIVQAMGGGALVPVTIALAGDLLPGRRRGLVIGVVVAAAEAGSVLGPLYGGGLLKVIDWRWIFWINLPLGALLALPIVAAFPGVHRSALRVDYSGGLLLGASLAMLALGLSNQALLPDGAAWQPALLGGAALLLLAFVACESRVIDPLFPLASFCRLPLVAAGVANFCVGGALILALVNIPLMTDTVFGQSALEGGLRLLRFTLMIPIGALIGGWLFQHRGYRPPMLAGFAIAALGFGLLSRWPLGISDPRLTLELMVGGLGFGLVLTPITVAALDHVEDHLRATSSALVTVMRMVGMIVGLSALSSWGQDRFQSLLAATSAPIQAAGEAKDAFDARVAAYHHQVLDLTLTFFHELFIAALIVCLLALLPSWLLGRRRL